MTRPAKIKATSKYIGQLETSNEMRVLGIETSCDETAAAVYDGRAGLLSHCLHSQVQMHAAIRRGRAGAGVAGSRPPAPASHSYGTRRGRHPARADRRCGVHRRARIGRRAARRRVGRPQSRFCLGTSRRSASITSKGHLLAPMLEAEPPAVPVPRAAGVRRPYVARRRARSRRLPDHRLVARRCRRRGVRQDGEAPRLALSRRAGAGSSSRAADGPGNSSSRGRCSIDRGSISASAV